MGDNSTAFIFLYNVAKLIESVPIFAVPSVIVISKLS